MRLMQGRSALGRKGQVHTHPGAGQRQRASSCLDAARAASLDCLYLKLLLPKCDGALHLIGPECDEALSHTVPGISFNCHKGEVKA